MAEANASVPAAVATAAPAAAETGPGKPSKREKVAPPEKGKPIKENVIYSKKARIVTDLHGGKELGTPDKPTARGAGNDTPLGTFLQGRQEGEIVVSAGDVFDRGANSWLAAQEMQGLVQSGEAVWNWGNHELLFMAAMTPPEPGNTGNIDALQTWFANGGDAMARSAGADISAYDRAVVRFASQGMPPDAARLKALRDPAVMAQVSEAIRNNANLTNLNAFLREHGKAYTIVDNVLVTHAGVLADPATGRLIDVKVNGVNYGRGLDAMDKIQEEIRRGGPTADRLIQWLANHGGDDDLNLDNPFWVRETNFQDVVGDPDKGHVLRDALNEQAKKRKTRVELVVVGHTPDMADRVGVTQTLDPNRPGGRRVPRFLFADSGYYKGGEARMVQVTLSADGKSSHIAYVDPEKNSDVQDGTMPGQSVLNRRYNLDKTFDENAAAAAPEPPAASERDAEAEPPAAEPAEGEAPTAEEAAATAAAADMAEAGIFDPELVLKLIATGVMRPKPGEKEGERANWRVRGDVLSAILRGSSDPRQKAVGIMLYISECRQEEGQLQHIVDQLKDSADPRLPKFRAELQMQQELRTQAERDLNDLKEAEHIDPDAIMRQFQEKVKLLAGADTQNPDDPVSVLSSVAQRLLDPKQANSRRENIGRVIDVLAPEMADGDKAEMTEKINDALRTQLKQHYGDVAKYALTKSKDAAFGAAGIIALLFILQMYRGIKANSPQQGMAG